MTDKEILEAIKKEHQLGKKKPLIINTIHPQDIDWLISTIEKMDKKLKQYEAALKFYADKKNHTENRGTRIFGDVFYDKGEIARKALEDEGR